MKFVLCILLALITPARAADTLVFFGTRQAGPGRGFSVAHFDPDTGRLTAPAFLTEAVNPAYFLITPDGKYLYTVNSFGSFQNKEHMGAVSAYTLSVSAATPSTPAAAKLTLINQQPSGGEDPSYISLDRTGHFALVANYQGNRVEGEGGTIEVLPIKADGSLGQPSAFMQHRGTSIDKTRQTRAFAHSIITDPSNHFAIVCDLGLDKVFVYKFDDQAGTLMPNDPPFVALKPGAGPRHPVFDPSGRRLYVIQEMGNQITAMDWDATRGVLAPFQEISTLPAGYAPGATATAPASAATAPAPSTAAEIRIHPNGRFLYATNRGHDSITVFSLAPDTGRLTPVQNISSGGNTPRNFDFDPTGRWLLVTNHGSDNTVLFSLDPSSGKLAQSGQPIAIPYPFCPRFLALSPP